MLPLLLESPPSKTNESNLGFVKEPRGTHVGRTMMLAELRRLLGSCSPDATYDDYRLAILEDNVLLKKTESTRRTSLRFLTELYALDSRVLLFRALFLVRIKLSPRFLLTSVGILRSSSILRE